MKRVSSVYLILIWMTSVLLFGCSKAETLGGAAVDEVVITGTPTWQNGISTLMNSKCATCHVIPFSFYSPYNTPKTLDLSVYDNVSTIRGASALTIWINGGILDKDLPGVSRKMPLPYATPLTESEMTALKSWATAGSPKQ